MITRLSMTALKQEPELRSAPSSGWPRFDPCRNIYLCEGCWNNGSWKHHCTLGFCECCRCNAEKPKSVKFTAEGQMSIPMDDVIVITTKS